MMRYGDWSREAVGARLKATRNALMLSQKEFAGPVGIKANTYCQYESGYSMPSLENLAAIVEYHGLTTDWVLRGDASGLKRNLWNLISAMDRLKRHQQERRA